MRKHRIDRLLYSAAQIRERIEGLAEAVARQPHPEPLVLIGILRGSFIFLADLVRALHGHGVRTRVDFMTLESYGASTESSGEVRAVKDFTLDVTGQPVLLVDDILDTGRTLDFAVRHLLARGARSVRTCVLLDKPSRRVAPIKADYMGFSVEDRFVVGYGLDYDGLYRELPYLSEVTLL